MFLRWLCVEPLILPLQYDPVTKNITTLIVAGGGGGKAYHLGYDSIRANGGLSVGGPGISSISPRAGPGKTFLGGRFFYKANKMLIRTQN